MDYKTRPIRQEMLNLMRSGGLINQALTDYKKDMKEELRDMLATWYRLF